VDACVCVFVWLGGSVCVGVVVLGWVGFKVVVCVGVCG